MSPEEKQCIVVGHNYAEDTYPGVHPAIADMWRRHSTFATNTRPAQYVKARCSLNKQNIAAIFAIPPDMIA